MLQNPGSCPVDEVWYATVLQFGALVSGWPVPDLFVISPLFWLLPADRRIFRRKLTPKLFLSPVLQMIWCFSW